MNKFHSTEYNGCGIYALFNMKNHMVYIGKSSNVKKRMKQHCFHFKRKDVRSNEMYKEDINNFIFVLLYKLPNDLYEMFGGIYEKACMMQFVEWGATLYNTNPRCKSINEYLHQIGVDFVFDAQIVKALKDSFIERTSRAPWSIKTSRYDWTEYISNHINNQ